MMKSKLYYAVLAINQMDQKKQREVDRSPEEIKAVSRLLEVAQKKHYLEDWQEGQQLRLSSSLHMRSRMMAKREQKPRERFNAESRSLQKRHEKERLQLLVREDINNQQESVIIEKDLPSILQKKFNQASHRIPNNDKLLSFHSNLTFYHTQRDSMRHNAHSSLTFYGKNAKNQQKNQKMSSNKNENSQDHLMKKKMNSSIVYFKPNKSQTIRELLNQMKLSKQKNDQIVLNSTQYESKFLQPQQRESRCFNQHELKQLSKYRNFLPFRQDQSILLNKIRSGDNIWKRKFKESWQRKKLDLEGKKTYFKRLIVKD